MRKTTPGSIGIAAALAILVRLTPRAVPLAACECITLADDKGKPIPQGDVIATGRVIEAHTLPHPKEGSEIEGTLELSDFVRGKAVRTAVVQTSANNCGVRFVPGWRYELHADYEAGGKLKTTVCMGSRRLGEDEPAPWALETAAACGCPLPSGSRRGVPQGDLVALGMAVESHLVPAAGDPAAVEATFELAAAWKGSAGRRITDKHSDTCACAVAKGIR